MSSVELMHLRADAMNSKLSWQDGKNGSPIQIQLSSCEKIGIKCDANNKMNAHDKQEQLAEIT